MYVTTQTQMVLYDCLIWVSFPTFKLANVLSVTTFSVQSNMKEEILEVPSWSTSL